jgi:filamentous hemagglutinin family protein
MCRVLPSVKGPLRVSSQALCVLLLLSVTSPADANPQGGTVTNGSASISSSGNTETITQSTQNAVINWQSFNIGANQITRFVQPKANATTLNRVNAGNPSQILGTLDANGNVILINPNGVFFGNGSQVDVNGLVATTANVTSQNFMQGKLNFTQPGSPNAQVVNNGTITAAQAGLVGLVAPTVINTGTINARLGHVELGSADTFTLDTYGDGLITLGVSGAVRQQLIQNSGTINARGGTIALTAGAGRQVVNSLVAMPGKLNAPTAVMRNGEIDITNATPSGQVQLSGSLNATGASGDPGIITTGGKINITGSEVSINSGAVVDASGYSGGGTINIGGNLHGLGPLMNAKSTIIETGATVDANANNNGNGGHIVVWSDQQTTVKGAVQARGGAQGGNGGFIETSSHGVLNISQAADSSALRGNAGEWLLDPASVTITNAADSNMSGCPACVPSGAVATSNLSTTTIDTALNAGTNVSVITGGDAAANTGDITVSNAILTTGTGSLTLSSYHDIIVNTGITLAGGNLTLHSDNVGNGSGNIRVGAAIATAGGNITIGGGNGVITAGSGYAVGNGGQASGVFVNGGAVNAGGGNIIVNGQGFNTMTNGNFGIGMNGGSIATTGTGTITLNGLGGGNTNSGTDSGVSLVGGAAVSSVNGAINVSGTGGGAGAGSGNFGVVESGAGATIKTTGSGSVFMTGIGGDAGGTGFNNHGVFINSINGIQATGTGGITVTGTGGASSSGGNDEGVAIGGSIVASGGPISISGTGGNGRGNGNVGLRVSGGAIANSGTGTINLSGTGQGNTNSGSNYGMEVDTGGVVSSVNGDLTILNATGGGAGTGTANFGLFVTGAGSSLDTTGSGNIMITGKAGNGAASTGLDVVNTNGIHTMGTGNITVNTDTMTLAVASNINSAGDVTVQPVTNSTTIGVGAGVGTLIVNDADLTWGGTLTLGNSASGNMDINPTASFANPVSFLAGGGSVTLDGAVTSTSASAGTTVLLDAGASFFNNVGAAAIAPGSSGRWLSYSTNPATDTVNSLASGFRRFNCTYGGACPSFPASGSGFLYSFQPMLTATPATIMVTYGATVPSLTGYGYNISGYLGSDAGGDAVTGSVNGTTPYTSTSTVPGGPYTINYGSGVLVSAMGYGITYANNSGGIIVNPAALLITAQNQSKTYGTLFTFAGTEFTTGGLINGDAVTSVTLASGGAAATATVLGGPYVITASAAAGTGLGNYNIVYAEGAMVIVPPTLPGTVFGTLTGGGAGEANQGGSNDGANGVRTAHGTFALAPPINPCHATAAQDTLPHQMTAMLDIIKISQDLAETLPFYKIQTHSFDASHFSCSDTAETTQ